MPYKDPEARRANARRYYHTNHERQTAYFRAYYHAHAEHVSAQRKTEREANPEKKRAQGKAYYEANKPQILARIQHYKQSNAEAVKVRNTKHRHANKERYYSYWKRYNAQKKGAPVNDLTHTQWIAIQEMQEHCCAYCGKRCKGRLTQDHITPLSQGGSHTVHNVIGACRSCNSKKGTRAPLKAVQPLLL